jgi:hypothetical protein
MGAVIGDEAMSKAMAFIRRVGHTQLDASNTGDRAAPRCAAGHLAARRGRAMPASLVM